MYGWVMDIVTEADIERSREDPRFRQILLARSLEQLLGTLHRLQHTGNGGAGAAEHLRQGALVAVDLADRIRAIDEQLSHVQKAG
jgi:hypothetical protein